ncbi:MAG: RidA family protein [Verrucomicrobiales bacterium]
MLATLQNELGDLAKVRRVVRVFPGMVNCPPDFTDHPKVINGCSELLAQVFGERGVAAAAPWVPLPANVAVEIEGVFEWRGRLDRFCATLARRNLSALVLENTIRTYFGGTAPSSFSPITLVHFESSLSAASR